MISLISAYLLKQRGYVDDPDEAHNKIKPKSWFKQIMADYPTDFDEHEGFTIIGAGGSGSMVTRISNILQGEVTSQWKMYIIEVADYSPDVAAWLYDGSGDYVSPGSLQPHQSVSYLQYMKRSAVDAIQVLLRVEEMSGAIYTRTVGVQRFAKHGDTLVIESQVPGAIGEDVAFAISLDVKLPIFSSMATGEAYADAAIAYQNEPTQANYEAVCAYIDLCLNPDG